MRPSGPAALRAGRAHAGTVVPMADAGVVVWYNHDLFNMK